jgi:hypothetical protein
MADKFRVCLIDPMGVLELAIDGSACSTGPLVSVSTTARLPSANTADCKTIDRFSKKQDRIFLFIP